MWKKISVRKVLIFILLCIFATLFAFSASASNNSATGNLKYVERSNWGADENLLVYNEDRPKAKLVKLAADFYTRYAQELKLQKIIAYNNKGEKLTWPLQYPQEISKIIIHHTASDKDEEDTLQIIKDIFYYHAIGRGWGDIGYNYIIDKSGTVYEGRYGGEGVVGGHAGPGNRGSIGIAVLGNYNEEEITPEALNTLIKLISQKTQLHNIDPKGHSYFRGKKLPNIIGHNSVMATSCPGENIIKLLPEIREKSGVNYNYNNNGGNNNVGNRDFAFEHVSNFEEIKIMPDSSLEYTIKLKNTGTETWAPSTRLIPHNNAVVAQGLYVHPYSLQEQRVAPGETGTFNVKLYSKLSDGFYYQTFTPQFNKSRISKQTINIPTIVERPVYNYEMIASELNKSSLRRGEKTQAIVALKNTGNIKWRNYGQNRISLGTENPRDRVSEFTKSNRMGYLKESLVEPGEVGHFVFNLYAPSESGEYEEYFSPVVEGISWLNGNGMKFIFKVS